MTVLKCNLRNKRGASYVEAALTVLTFLLTVFFIIDLARYFYTQSVFNHALGVGIDLATKTQLEVYTNQATCITAPPPGVNPCTQYLNDVAAIVNRVDAIANLVSTPPNIPSGVQRVAFRHYFIPPHTNNLLPPQVWDVAFMRPGEEVMRVSTNEIECYPSLRPCPTDTNNDGNYNGSGENDVGMGWPKGSETWKEVFLAAPISMAIEASFDPVTPFIPNLRVRSQIYGTRRSALWGIGFANNTVPSPPGGTGGAGNNGNENEHPPEPPDPCDCCYDDQLHCGGAPDEGNDWSYCFENSCGE